MYDASEGSSPAEAATCSDRMGEVSRGHIAVGETSRRYHKTRDFVIIFFSNLFGSGLSGLGEYKFFKR